MHSESVDWQKGQVHSKNATVRTMSWLPSSKHACWQGCVMNYFANVVSGYRHKRYSFFQERSMFSFGCRRNTAEDIQIQANRLLLGIPESLRFHDLYISAWQSKFGNYSLCVKQMSFAHKNGRFRDFFHYFSVSPLLPPCRSAVKKIKIKKQQHRNATRQLFFGTDVTMVHSFLLYLS